MKRRVLGSVSRFSPQMAACEFLHARHTCCTTAGDSRFRLDQWSAQTDRARNLIQAAYQSLARNRRAERRGVIMTFDESIRTRCIAGRSSARSSSTT